MLLHLTLHYSSNDFPLTKICPNFVKKLSPIGWEAPRQSSMIRASFTLVLLRMHYDYHPFQRSWPHPGATWGTATCWLVQCANQRQNGSRYGSRFRITQPANSCYLYQKEQTPNAADVRSGLMAIAATNAITIITTKGMGIIKIAANHLLAKRRCM